MPHKNKVIEFAKQKSKAEGFKASKGWFDKFTKRHNYNLDEFRINKKRKVDENNINH